LYPGKFRQRLARLERLNALTDKDERFWKDLVKTWMIDRPRVELVARPSKAEAEAHEEAEKARVAAQKERLGEKGLAENKQKLASADEKNNQEVPDEMISKVPVPSPDNLHLIPVTTYTNVPSVKTTRKTTNLRLQEELKVLAVGEQGGSFPVAMQVDHVATPFITLRAMLDSQDIPEHLRKYIELYTALTFVSPIQDGDDSFTHEEVVEQLMAETVAKRSCNGFGGGLDGLVYLYLKFPQDKYQTAVLWLKRLLWKSVFLEKYIKIEAHKLVMELTRAKRNGNVVARSMLAELDYTKGSNRVILGIESQITFLQGILESLNTEAGVAKVIRELNEFRDLLTQPSRIRCHMVVNAVKLGASGDDNFSAMWADFLPRKKDGLTPMTPEGIAAMAAPRLKANEVANTAKGRGVALGLGAVDSAFLLQSRSTGIDYNHPDIGAVMVAEQFLTALEGPMWKTIRGKGYSYGYGIRSDPESGLETFNLFKAGQVLEGYKESLNIVKGYLETPDDMQVQLNKVSLESTKSTVVSEIIGAESTVSEAAKASFLNSLRGLPLDYNTQLLKKVDSASLVEVKDAMKKYIEKLFHKDANFVIVGSKDKVAEIITGFDKELGLKVEEFDSVDAFFNPPPQPESTLLAAAVSALMVGVAGLVWTRLRRLS